MPATSKEHYIKAFAQTHTQLAGLQIDWVQQLRQQAINRFAEIGFPTIRQDEWKYTRTAAIEKGQFTSAAQVDNTVTLAQLQPFFLGTDEHYRLTFINGHFAPSLSVLPNTLPAGVTLIPLSKGLIEYSEIIEQHLACYTNSSQHGFTALNTALMNDGVYLHLAAQTQVEKPIHILFVTTQSPLQIANYPRNLIIAEPHSQATVLEHYVSLADNCYFTNAITEIVLDEQASIEHIKLQQESTQAFHIGTVHAHQAQHSQLTSHVFTLGGALARSDTHIQLAAENTACTLNGLYIASDKQHADHHTLIDHLKPHGTSNQKYKGIISEQGRAIFNGKVVVHPNAQKTNAQQSNQNLLLSKGAEVDTKPQLEIYADDIKCSHGTTVGQLDEDALFYLRSRGIPENIARNTLTYAFASEMITRIKDATLRAKLLELVLKILSADQEVCELL